MKFPSQLILILVVLCLLYIKGLNKDSLKEAIGKLVVTENLSLKTIEPDSFIDLI